MLFKALSISLAAIFLLTGCQHTISGMKQDIHEDSAPDRKPAKTTKVNSQTTINSPAPADNSF